LGGGTSTGSGSVNNGRMADSLFRRASMVAKPPKASASKPARRATTAGLQTSEHVNKRGALDTHALEDKDDVLMGGALSTDDLLELLDMEMENLAEKCKGAEGITKGDLRPLIKAIGDLRAVNLGQDDRVKRAVEFQMRCTSQLVAQQEIKSALQTRSVADVQACLEKIKSYKLQNLNLAKRLESEWVAIQKELSKEAKAEIHRVATENKRLHKELEENKAAGGATPKDAPGRRKSFVPSFFNKRSGAQPDEFALEDAYASMSVKDLRTMCMENGLDPTGVVEKGELVKMVQDHLATKSMAKAKAKSEPPPQVMPGGSVLAMAGVSSELEEKQRAAAQGAADEVNRQRAQYDLLIEAMRRVKAAMDTPERGPGAIIAAAGPGLDLVSGDRSAVHLWLGDYHGVVKPSTAAAPGPAAAEKTTIVIGEVDSKDMQPREIRVLENADDTRVVDLATQNRALMQRIEQLEKELRSTGGKPTSPRLGLDVSPRASAVSPRLSSLGSPSVHAGEAVAALMRERADTTTATDESPSGVAGATGVDAAADGANAESGAATSGVALKDDPRFHMYFKMLNVGLPKDAVRHKMVQDNKDPAVLDCDPNQPLPASALASTAASPGAVALKDDARFTPYFKMIAVGVPRFAVEQKMRSKGLDPAVLDADLNAPAPGGADAATETGATTSAKLAVRPRKVPDEQWKKLHWQSILAPVPQKSIWLKAQDFDLLAGDKRALQQLFALKVSAAKEADKMAAPSEEKEKKVQILETARANNIAIVLSRLQMSSKDVRRMVFTLHLNTDQFSADDVRAVLAFVPTSEEAEKLRAYRGDRERLGVAEKHMLAIMDVHRYKQRISCFLFRLKFSEVCADLEVDVDALRKGCDDLLTSDKFPKLLGMVLKIGNLFNSQGGVLEPDDGFKPAVGFRLNALGKLRLAKSYGSTKTALHALVDLAQDRQRQVLNFLFAETDGIRGAANVSMQQMKTSLKSLALGVKELDNERRFCAEQRNDKNATISHEDEIFFQAIDSFYKRAREELNTLTVKVTGAEKQYNELLAYLGEDPEMTPEVLFKSLIAFFDDVALAHNENELERAKTAKKSRDKKALTKKLSEGDVRDVDADQAEEAASGAALPPENDEDVL